jgi:hypothetical protein
MPTSVSVMLDPSAVRSAASVVERRDWPHGPSAHEASGHSRSSFCSRRVVVKRDNAGWSLLWSPVVATVGNQRQIAQGLKPRKQVKSVAIGCHRLPEKFHGKEGVDGSSPSEGSAKVVHSRTFLFGCTCTVRSVR